MDSHKLDKRLTQQQNLLSNARGVSAQFHLPESNNFVFSLVSKKLDQNRYYSEWAKKTEGLNLADSALLKYCCKYLEDNPDFAATYFAKRWYDCIKDRVNLKSGQWSDALISRLEDKGELDGTFPEHLKVHAPKVLGLFVQIPESITGKVRINIYLRANQTVDLVERLINESVTPLNETTERIEIAKNYVVDSADDGSGGFPRVIIYPNGEIASSQHDFNQLISLIGKLCDSIGQKERARAEYAYVFSENCTITEGFFLYKRYLKRLGLLDSVYSAASNYAFLHDSQIAGYL